MVYAIGWFRAWCWVMYFEIRATKDGQSHVTIKNSAVIAVAAARMMHNDRYSVVVVDEDGVEYRMHELDQLLRFRLRTAAKPVVKSMAAKSAVRPTDAAAMPSPAPAHAPSAGTPFARPLALKLIESVARYGRSLGFH